MALAIIDALKDLERACEELAQTRSMETYRSMVDNDRATLQLLNLDAARRRAREAIESDRLDEAQEASWDAYIKTRKRNEQV